MSNIEQCLLNPKWAGTSECSRLMAHQEPLIREPEIRPIGQEQIVAEVKTIYSGLAMVENKCIEVNKLQTEISEERSDLTQGQWQALLTLHRTLLHEHHNFFISSKRPSKNATLKRFAAKFRTPARMWRHGIHYFLELLRHDLPQSRGDMATFIYLAYSIMAHLDETQTFYETWTEPLEHLGRYRMAIEDGDTRDREIWTCTPRRWYAKPSNNSPTTGRLHHHHHLAILARPNALKQRFCYSKTLCVFNPLQSTRESILTLFDPDLKTAGEGDLQVDFAFLKVHGILFTRRVTEKELSNQRRNLLGHLDNYIGRTGRRWLESGYFTGISIACSLLGFGDEKNILMRAVSQPPEYEDSASTEDSLADNLPKESLEAALSFAVETWSTVIRRWSDINTLTHCHTTLVLLLHMARFQRAMVRIEKEVPWKLISTMLNYLQGTTDHDTDVENRESQDAHADPKDDSHRLLPDSYALHGLLYAEGYLPQSMSPNEDAKDLETNAVWDTQHTKHCAARRLGFPQTDNGCITHRPAPLSIRLSFSKGLCRCHKRRNSIRGRDNAKAAVVKELSSGCHIKHVKCFRSVTWISGILSVLSSVRALKRA